ncbi:MULTISPECIES: hypothetical protein [unclassified Enterococcus]|jgi:hypothetical protein|uniref:hypothetical protein n=1 Tax=unclassified Enterococcus TaxID=2608891 RepID=UPI003D2950E3
MLFEFYNQRKSKIFYNFLAITIFLSLMVFFSQFMLVNNNLRDFTMYADEALRNGEDINQLLRDSFGVSFQNNIELIENPLKHYYIAYHSSLAAMNPQNGINQLLSSSFFVLFPFIAGIYGIVVANADIKYQTLKTRIELKSIKKANLNKILASLLSLLLFLSAAIGTFLLLQSFSPAFIQIDGSINADMTLINQISYLHLAPLQIIMVFFASSICFIFCFYFTVVTKKPILTVFLLGAYNLALPPLGKYDLKDILLSIYPTLFNTNASTFRINTGSGVELTVSLVVSICILLLGYVFLMEYIQNRWSISGEK